MNDEKENYLKSIYYDAKHPAGFSSVGKIHLQVKKEALFSISKGQIEKWLSAQDLYTKHKTTRKVFKRRRVIVPRKFYQFDVDTANMTKFEKGNLGYKYFLIMIDILSRYVWTCGLKTLQGKEMVEALKTKLNQSHLPEKIRSDLGSEFVNVNVKRYLKGKKIEQFGTTNETKANFAEAAIKSIKLKLIKAMHHEKTDSWLKLLDDVTHNYNNSFHRSIGMSPYEALKTDDVLLWKAQYDPKPVQVKKESKKPPRKTSVYKYKVGDKVKLSFLRYTFQRAYDQSWSDEIFYVASRYMKESIPQYTLKDFDNDLVTGSFYEAEMQKIVKDEGPDTVYKIEKILKRRRYKGVKQVKVSWEGYHAKFNSWINESELGDV